MIFSNKIYRLDSGKNISMYAISENELNLYLYKKSMNLYDISINNKLNCTFFNKSNHHKVIKLNNKHSCVCYGNEMMVIENEEIK